GRGRHGPTFGGGSANPTPAHCRRNPDRQIVIWIVASSTLAGQYRHAWRGRLRSETGWGQLLPGAVGLIPIADVRQRAAFAVRRSPHADSLAVFQIGNVEIEQHIR